MKKRTFRRLAIPALAGAGLLFTLGLTDVVPAAAQAPINPEQACKDDAFRLCNDFIPDRERVGACLRRNARSLSRDCRTVVMGGGRYRAPTRRTYRRHYYHHRHHE